jgi:hypothetical protein
MIEDSRSLAYLDEEYKLRVESTIEDQGSTVEDQGSTVQMTKYCLRLAFIHNYACGV